MELNGSCKLIIPFLALFSTTTAVLITKSSVAESVWAFKVGAAKFIKNGDLGFDRWGKSGFLGGFDPGIFG